MIVHGMTSLTKKLAAVLVATSINTVHGESNVPDRALFTRGWRKHYNRYTHAGLKSSHFSFRRARSFVLRHVSRRKPEAEPQRYALKNIVVIIHRYVARRVRDRTVVEANSKTRIFSQPTETRHDARYGRTASFVYGAPCNSK